MLLAVVIVFGFCWFPFIIYTYVVTYVRDNQNQDPPCVMSIIEQCAMYLAYFISPINPAIYFMFSENYRNGLTKLSGRCLYPLLNKLAFCRSKSTDEKNTPEVQESKRRRRPGKTQQVQDMIELRAL